VTEEPSVYQQLREHLAYLQMTAAAEHLAPVLDRALKERVSATQVLEEDPVEFLEAFVRNYPDGQWRIRERERLISAIERAAGENTGKEASAV
jgi:hypothetical protein